MRVSGHSMVAHPDGKSLLLFGGVMSDVPRFSRLNDQLYIFDLASRRWSAQQSLPSSKHKPSAR